MLNKKTDREILTKFEKEKPWGMSCSVDLSKCNAQKIRDADAIKQFVIKLCDLIKMKRFGEAEKQLEKLARANMQNNGNFAEWLHGITGKIGKTEAGIESFQGWNAAMYIAAYESVKRKKCLV